MNKEKLKQLCKVAEKREMCDDHLNREERIQIVKGYKKLNPDFNLPADLDEAFVKIVFK